MSAAKSNSKSEDRTFEDKVLAAQDRIEVPGHVFSVWLESLLSRNLLRPRLFVELECLSSVSSAL